MDGRTPIALFSYDRPAHVGRVLDTLAGCRRFDECRLHIFCDGARGEEDRPRVEEARAVVRERAPELDAVVVARPANLGLSRSVVDGVSALCEQHGRVIVVEDDFQVAPGFLDFLLQALEKYEDEAAVYQVSAYMFPVSRDLGGQARFLRLTSTRGWATWARAWAAFDGTAAGAAEAMADPVERRRFDLGGSYPYSRMLLDRLAGRNDSWGILWWWTVFRASGLTLFPPHSLVWVGGLDGSGTHSGVSRGADINSVAAGPQSVEQAGVPALPPAVAADDDALRAVAEFLGSTRRPGEQLTRGLARLMRGVSPSREGSLGDQGSG